MPGGEREGCAAMTGGAAAAAFGCLPGFLRPDIARSSRSLIWRLDELSIAALLNPNLSPGADGETQNHWRLETGDRRLDTGDWRLETGDWRLETGDFRSGPL